MIITQGSSYFIIHVTSEFKFIGQGNFIWNSIFLFHLYSFVVIISDYLIAECKTALEAILSLSRK